jgi:hypothetical protein
MLSQFCQLLFQQIQLLYFRSAWGSILLLLVLCNSCSPPAPPDVDLKISVVKSAGRPGIYNVTGSSNLPDRSRITVAAIRYLRPAEERSLSPDQNATYSILARQIVEVAQGKWQSTLNLWQVAPDGRFQEVWQRNQSELGLSLNPATGVAFLATFEPAGQITTPKQQSEQIQELQGSLVRFTSEGEQYVQASQTLPIALPAKEIAPSGFQAEDINGGWGNRSLAKPEPIVSRGIRSQTPKTDQTNAPLSPSEFLR